MRGRVALPAKIRGSEGIVRVQRERSEGITWVQVRVQRSEGIAWVQVQRSEGSLGTGTDLRWYSKRTLSTGTEISGCSMDSGTEVRW